jgi:hypothetical protein
VVLVLPPRRKPSACDGSDVMEDLQDAGEMCVFFWAKRLRTFRGMHLRAVLAKFARCAEG